MTDVTTEDCPLRSALAALEPKTAELLESFQARLSEQKATLEERMFGDDPERRRGIVLNLIVLVAETHEEPDAVCTTVRRMGERHRSRGISQQDFKAFGTALRKAMADVLGEAWTPRADWLWRRSFRRLAQEMASSRRCL